MFFLYKNNPTGNKWNLFYNWLKGTTYGDEEEENYRLEKKYKQNCSRKNLWHITLSFISGSLIGTLSLPAPFPTPFPLPGKLFLILRSQFGSHLLRRLGPVIWSRGCLVSSVHVLCLKKYNLYIWWLLLNTK